MQHHDACAILCAHLSYCTAGDLKLFSIIPFCVATIALQSDSIICSLVVEMKLSAKEPEGKDYAMLREVADDVEIAKEMSTFTKS